MENVINVQWRNQYAARRFYLVVILDATIVVVSSFKNLPKVASGKDLVDSRRSRKSKITLTSCQSHI